MKVGFHVSISDSIDLAVDRAVALGCNTFQIFTSNPRGWKSKTLDPKEIHAFVTKVNSHDLKPVFSHTLYLSNLASPRDHVYAKSVKSLISELKRCRKLGIPYVVTHLGSHLGAGIQFGFQRIVKAINTAFSAAGEEVMLLLENTAGTTNSMGSTFENIQYIIERTTYSRSVGMCFDTSHAFAAGYDMRTMQTLEETLRELDETVGFHKLRLVHLNDSLGDMNSHLDRHEHIGLGKIGEEGFRNVLRSRLGEVPLILETPRDTRRSDIENLSKVRDLAERI